MPVYNAGKFLQDAIDSVLKQTFENFELIAINDGSTDKSGEILDQYARLDPRIIVKHRENRGLVATLNESISLARGDYIARLDSDDIAFSDRLSRQVAILSKKPKVVLVAGCFEVFDEDSEYLYREVIPAYNEDIKRAMYLRNPIGHSSVMFRKSAFDKVGGYSSECGPTEDYELWSRLAREGEFYALEHAVFKWRVNTQGITSTQNAEQIRIMKSHTNMLWDTNPPIILSRKHLKKITARYYHTFDKYGVSMKEVVLSDNAQLGVKMIKRGHIIKGLHQLLVVASLGRSGLKTVYRRIMHVYKGGSQALYRSIRIKKAISSTDVVD